jgi:hypothetical protein
MIVLVLALAAMSYAAGTSVGSSSRVTLQNWRPATEKELEGVIPARAQVERERIETDSKTAAGVTDGRGKFIAGVLMITAGYSAEGKYSHFFITQAPVKIGEALLNPGDYVFGFKRADADTLEVKFHEAATGRQVAVAKAKRDNRGGPIRSFGITPPGSTSSVIQLGRFSFEYKLAE